MVGYNSELRPLARTLRHRMTQQEKHLWYDFLRGYKLQFRRQKPFGDYIVDFYCSKVKVVIEVDGAQHYDDAGRAADVKRTAFLESLGLVVLRFTNRQVNMSFGEVCQMIDQTIQDLL